MKECFEGLNYLRSLKRKSQLNTISSGWKRGLHDATYLFRLFALVNVNVIVKGLRYESSMSNWAFVSCKCSEDLSTTKIPQLGARERERKRR